MRLIAILSGIASIGLLFFGFIFIWSAGYVDPTTGQGMNSGQLAMRLGTGSIMLIVGFALAYAAYAFSRKPTTIIHQVEVSGQMKAAPIKCPNCGGSVDASQIKINSGVPYATCPYCGKTFEVTEEPKW